jgi:hypothetical protein
MFVGHLAVALASKRATPVDVVKLRSVTDIDRYTGIRDGLMIDEVPPASQRRPMSPVREDAGGRTV